MKKDWSHLDRFKDQNYQAGKREGFFCFPIKETNTGLRCLSIIATDGAETKWEHVSAKIVFYKREKFLAKQEVPSWKEMCILKDMFWEPDEAVFQIHPPIEDYVNFHPCVLHLWKHTEIDFLLPPFILVGPKT